MEISGTTGLIGLIGRPVAHSKSPAMHNLSFQTLGLDYAYLCFDSGEDELESVVSGLRALGARGFNCTLPVKNKMAKLVDHLSPAARLIGAVNTVVIEDGILTGYNTDGIGFMKSLEDAGYEIPGKKMTLLGAGGAGSSMLVQAALDGVAEISVFCRKTSRAYERAVSLTEELNQKTEAKVQLFYLEDLEALRREVKSSHILVNATNIGMSPKEEECPIPEKSFFTPGQIVYDAIYQPAQTKLLTWAKEAGCKTMNGNYMLLFQGAEAFRLWTGEEMPVELVKEKVFHK